MKYSPHPTINHSILFTLNTPTFEITTLKIPHSSSHTPHYNTLYDSPATLHNALFKKLPHSKLLYYHIAQATLQNSPFKTHQTPHLIIQYSSNAILPILSTLHHLMLSTNSIIQYYSHFILQYSPHLTTALSKLHHPILFMLHHQILSKLQNQIPGSISGMRMERKNHVYKVSLERIRENVEIIKD